MGRTEPGFSCDFRRTLHFPQMTTTAGTGGVFYANREDPAVVVPKRFGIGWTLNLGRPASWLIVAGLVAICVAVLVATMQG